MGSDSPAFNHRIASDTVVKQREGKKSAAAFFTYLTGTVILLRNGRLFDDGR